MAGEELLQIADREFDWCQRELKKASREMGYGDDYMKAIEAVKQKYVEPGKQPELIKKLAYEAIDYVEKNDLVTVPKLARDGWRMNLSAARTLGFRDGEGLVEVQVGYARDAWQLTANGQTTLARGKKLEDDRFAVELDDRRLIASVVAVDDKRHVFLHGATHVLFRDDPLHLVEAGGNTGGGLTAPMPGKVVALLAQPGQKVDKGAPLLILEAMKMEHTITAPAAGTVEAFCYAAGEQVSDGAALVEFTAD